MHDPGLLRIGELSRRAGVSPELLRAWERRYRLLRPARSQGGLRLYSLEDLERVRLMQQHLARGLAAAEAAALATSQPAAPGTETLLVDAKYELADALGAFDEPRTHAVFDSLLATATLDTVLATVVMPYLHELGADTPLTSVADAAHASAAVLTVVSAVTPEPFRAHRDELRTLARGQRLCLGGAGAVEAGLDIDAEILSGDLVGEAERVTAFLEAR